MTEMKIKTLRIHCPKCGKYIQPIARMINWTAVDVPLGRYGVNYPVLDFEKADIEGDYIYVCPDCQDKLADTILEVTELLKEHFAKNSEKSHEPPKQPRCPRCHKFMRRHQSGGIGKTSRVFKCSCGDWSVIRVFDLEDGKWVEWSR